jgi:DNA-binding NarL/FixJ family response regulator
MTPIRILVADDHPVVRDGLVAILSTQPDFAVVGEAANGAEVIAQVTRLHPDVLLLDLEMPGMDGVAALERLRAQGQNVRAIAFTAFDTDERILGAVRAGALGYLLKGTPREEIFRAVRTVVAGGSLLEPVVAMRVLRQVRQPTPAPSPLTARETEVLHRLAQGRQNKEIARDLNISERTVKFHVTALLQKLGAGNRTEAVTIATQRGLIQIPRDARE